MRLFPLSGLALLLSLSLAAAEENPIFAAVQKRAVYEHCRNRGTISIDDRIENFRLGVNVEVYADTKGFLKIRATKAAFQAFLILMTPQGVQFYLPRERKLFEGTAEQFTQGIGLFSPELMLELILKGHPEFLKQEWISSGKSAEGGEVYNLKAEAGAEGLKVTLGGEEGMIQKVEYLLGDGQVYREICYDRYMPVKINGEEKFFPRILRLTWPTLERKVTVNLRGVDDEPVINDETWTVNVTSDIQRLPLEQLTMEGDKE